MSAKHTMIASQTMIAFGKFLGDHIIVTEGIITHEVRITEN